MCRIHAVNRGTQWSAVATCFIGDDGVYGHVDTRCCGDGTCLTCGDLCIIVGNLTVVAGLPFGPGNRDGLGSDARLSAPTRCVLPMTVFLVLPALTTYNVMLLINSRPPGHVRRLSTV